MVSGANVQRFYFGIPYHGVINWLTHRVIPLSFSEYMVAVDGQWNANATSSAAVTK